MKISNKVIINNRVCGHTHRIIKDALGTGTSFTLMLFGFYSVQGKPQIPALLSIVRCLECLILHTLPISYALRHFFTEHRVGSDATPLEEFGIQCLVQGHFRTVL